MKNNILERTPLHINERPNRRNSSVFHSTQENASNSEPKYRRHSSVFHSTQENASNSEPKDTVDELLMGIGLGPWQILPMLAVFFIQGTYSSQHIATVFTNMPLDFRCLSRYAKEANNNIYNNTCYYTSNTNSSLNTTMESCKIFEYNTTMFKSTFTSEFNLVCEKSWLSNLYKSIGFMGVIFGCTFTSLSDKYGRVTIMRFVTGLYVISTLLIGLSPNVYIIIICRFVVGFCYELINGSAFTLMMEMLPHQYRSPITALFSNIANTIFTIITGGVSYFIRDWRILHLVLSFPIFLLGVIVLFLDKSPRWLIINNQTVKVITVLEKAAKLNKSKMPDREKIIAFCKEYCLDSSKQEQYCEISYSKVDTLKSLLGRPAMRRISLIFPIVSLLTSSIYYTIPLNANNFSFNPFLYIIVLGISYFPSNLVAPYLMNKLGNINASCVTYSITMLCLVTLVFVNKSLMWVQFFFIFTAMMMIEVNYMICYVMSSELFPTVVRTAGFGIGAFAKHSGVLIASNIVDLAVTVDIPWLPNAVGAGCCVLVALIIKLLPETSGKFLCDTVDHVEQRDQGCKINYVKYEHA